jgi:hypothetical protein
MARVRIPNPNIVRDTCICLRKTVIDAYTPYGVCSLCGLHPVNCRCDLTTPKPRLAVDNTGRLCSMCGKVTFGFSDACGNCGAKRP